MSGDWIKLHRKLLKDPIFPEDQLLRLWVYCLLKANWKDATWVVPGTRIVIDIPRGSFATGRTSLHRDLYPRKKRGVPSALTIWRNLQFLAHAGYITLQNMNNHCTLVSICNYGSYQDMLEESEQRLNNGCTTVEQRLNTIEESKEGKEVNTCSVGLLVEEVVAHYRTYHPRSFKTLLPDMKEYKCIAKRLKEGRTVEELKQAIDGNHRSPHHCGKNANGTKYHGLELIMRDSAHVLMFLQVPKSSVGAETKPPPTYAQALLLQEEREKAPGPNGDAA